MRRGDGRCEMMSRLTGLPRAKYYPDGGRWGLFPIGSRMSARPFSLNLPCSSSLQVASPTRGPQIARYM